MSERACLRCGQPAERTCLIEAGLFELVEVPMCGTCYSEYYPAYSRGRVEFRKERRIKFKAILFTVELRGAERIIGALARWLGAPLSRASAAGVFLTLFTIALGLYAAMIRFIDPKVLETARALWSKAPGYGVVGVPGIDPMIPLLQGWIALVIALTAHELGHGIVAMRLGYSVKSLGLLFLGPILLGAFVRVEGRRSGELYKVMGAGVVMNLLVAAAALAILLLTSGWAWHPLLLFIPPELARLYGIGVELDFGASALFYIWLINLAIALAASAPLVITDGSYILLLILERLGMRRAPLITKIISFGFLGILLATIVLDRLPL